MQETLITFETAKLAKIQSSVLFLLSAEKDKKKSNKDFINILSEELKTNYCLSIKREFN